MTNTGSSKMSIEDMIGHYQRSIEKSENDPKRLLHCLAKLHRMNVTVQHLQATGIGRTVNQLRKDDGEVGVAAKALVSKWKEMVAAEESSECSEDDEEESAEDPDETSGNETERSPHEKIVEKGVFERRDSNSSDTQRIQSGGKSHHHHRQQQLQQECNFETSIKSNIEDGSRKSSDHNGHHSHSSNSRETSHSRPHHLIHAAARSSRNHSDDNGFGNGTYEHNNACDGGSSSNDEVLSENERIKDHSSTQSRSDRNHKSKHHHGHESGHTPSRVDKREHHTKHSSHKSSSSSSSTREKDRNESCSSSHKDRQSSSKSERNNIDALTRETQRKHGDHSKSSMSKHKRKAENDATTSHGEGSSSQENGEMIASKRQKSDTNTSSFENASSRREHKKSSKPSKHTQANDSIEIDHSMGTSFADALGMIVPTSSTSKSSGNNASLSSKSSSKSAPTSSHSSTKHKSSSRSGDSSGKNGSKSSNGSKKVDVATYPPPLLSPKADLPPLEDISVDLPAPTITNNYKPMPLNPLVMDCVFKQEGSSSSRPTRLMTSEEALGASITSKKERLKIYSGAKPGASYQPHTLLQTCLRFLQRNIDAIEHAGPATSDILRPVLERATPEQLANIEHFNPHFMDDNDVLWKQHCVRKFRSKQRQEMETWRDMYWRCHTEQEERLNSLTNNIKMSQSVAVPVKQTKLTDIDSMVKPPRNVIKKQMQFGTERKLVATPAARTVALSSVAANITRAGDVRLRTTAAMRDPAQIQSSHSGLKARKAPLMAKTLQLMKGRFKR